MPAAPDSPLELRRILERVLANEIGTFSSGAKAFWIDPPRIPAALSCTGLLCRISRYELLNESTHSHSSQQAYQNFNWQLFLVQYDASSSGMAKMDRAKKAIEKTFPRHQQRVLESVSDVYPQIRFLLNFSRYVNTSP